MNPDRQLVRALGLRQLTAHIVNYTVGSGIFVVPAIAAAQLGTAAPLAYLACAVIMACVVLNFAEAGSRVTATGGPYAYIDAGLGPYFGLVSGLLLNIAQIASAGAIVALLGQTAARLLQLQHPAWPLALTTTLVLALVAANVRGVRLGARIVEWSTVAKLVPLLFLVFAGLWFMTPSHLVIDTLPSSSALAATTGMLIFAFIGLESALMPTGEVRDAARTVPLATLLALAIATVLYLTVQAVATGLLGPALATDSVAPLASAARTFSGQLGASLLLAGATISMLGWTTGAILAAPRTLFAMARDGTLPRYLAAVHPTRRTPHAAIITFGVLVLAVSASGTFTQLMVIASLAVLCVYVLVALSVLALRRRNVRTEREPMRLPGGPFVPLVTCVLIAWVALQTATAKEALAFGAVWLASLAIHWRRRGRRLAQSEGTT
jgi:basic amino acid/polyamine antiporter, APA family